MNKPPSPITARLATPIPITEPPVKETFKALLRLVLAACVVRTFDFVAIFIPMYPAKAEMNAPNKNEIPINALEFSTNVPEYPRRILTMIPKIIKTRHSAFKNANAPAAMASAISIILGSPASCRTTQPLLKNMTIKPRRPNAGTK